MQSSSHSQPPIMSASEWRGEGRDASAGSGAAGKAAVSKRGSRPSRITHAGGLRDFSTVLQCWAYGDASAVKMKAAGITVNFPEPSYHPLLQRVTPVIHTAKLVPPL